MSGAPPPGRVHGVTGRELWRARVEATPEATAIRHEDVAWTFAEADEAMLRIAGGLAGHGVRRGTPVGVGLGNGEGTLLIHAALRELGAVIVPLVPGLTEPELLFQLRHSSAEVLVVGEPVASVLPGVLDQAPALRTVIREDGDFGALRASEPLARAGGVDDDLAPWALLYTSGSTGQPKGVMLPAGAFASGGMGYADRFGVRADDNYILTTPMAHVIGALTAPSMALYTGACLTIVDRFSPSQFWGQVARSAATVSILFPSHLNLLLELAAEGPPAGASTLRLVITHAWLEAFRERFGVELGLCWGMTETGAGSTGGEPGERGPRPGYVGRAMNGVEVSIIDGEICLRNRHHMLEYLDDPQATAAVLDAEGWVHSGDRGEIDEDGRLFYDGRIKNMIKRSGENVSPEEVELTLTEHPAVAECIVLGVPDRIRSEEVVAIVVTAPGSAVAPEELLDFARERLARYKLPRYIEIRSELLPRLGVGKIDRPGIVRDLDLEACWDRQRQTAGPSNPYGR